MKTFLELQAGLSEHLDDDGNQIYELTKVQSWINQAIEHLSGLGFVRTMVDTSVTTTAGTLTYNAPAGITNKHQIARVQLLQSGGTYEDVQFGLVTDSSGLPDNPTEVLIELDDDPGTTTMRVIYEAAHPTLTDDNDECELPAQLIYMYGSYLAHRWAAQQRSQIDRKFHIEERNAALQEFSLTYPTLLPRGEVRSGTTARYF